MIIKCVEIRDRMTCVPAIAILMLAEGPVQGQFLSRCGYPRHPNAPAVVLMRLADQRANSAPYDWADRTHQTAHLWITEHFGEMRDGQVVDVRVILGEPQEPAEAELST